MNETTKIQVRVKVARKGRGYLLTAFIPVNDAETKINEDLVSPRETFFNHPLVPKWGDLWQSKNLRMSSVYVEGEEPEKYVKKEITRLQNIAQFNREKKHFCGEHVFEI